MTTQEIEEIVDEASELFPDFYRGVTKKTYKKWLSAKLTTLTTKHQEEIEKAVEEAEDRGIIRTLKWLTFLFTYKSVGLIKIEIEKFIRECEMRHPSLKDERRY